MGVVHHSIIILFEAARTEYMQGRWIMGRWRRTRMLPVLETHAPIFEERLMTPYRSHMDIQVCGYPLTMEYV